MALIPALFLCTLHYVYSLLTIWHSFWARFAWFPPQPLLIPRRRVPKHLAILFIADAGLNTVEVEACLVQSVIDVVGWCCAVGIEKLTVYDEYGKILSCSQIIRSSLPKDVSEASCEYDVEYPLTPPLSDHSESRPVTPLHSVLLDMHTSSIHFSKKQKKPKHRKAGVTQRKENVNRLSMKQFTLCLASRESSKPAIASVAQELASRNRRIWRDKARFDDFILTVEEFHNLLDCYDTLSSPDFMIVHPLNPLHRNQRPLELHGYPPWHIRLTEIYHNRHHLSSKSIDESTFNHALDEFATAEMRFGK